MGGHRDNPAGVKSSQPCAPRKANLVVYLVGGVLDRNPKLPEQLGPHKVTPSGAVR